MSCFSTYSSTSPSSSDGAGHSLPDDLETRSLWQFGSVAPTWWQRWLRLPTTPFSLNPALQRGIILGAGQTREHSLFRLATNAAWRGWKVFYLDAQGTPACAARFVAAMRAAGRQAVYAFPNQHFDGFLGTPPALFERLLALTPARNLAARPIWTACLSVVFRMELTSFQPLHEIIAELEHLRAAKHSGHRLPAPYHTSALAVLSADDMDGPLAWLHAVADMLGNALHGSWSFDSADAAYIDLSAWHHPGQARLLAQFILTDLASFLAERAVGRPRVLLLLNQPSQVLPRPQIAPLFSWLEQHSGSLFLAEQSIHDLGNEGPRLLGSATTVIAHRGGDAWPLRSHVPRTALQSLPDGECYITSAGHLMHVCLDPVPFETADVLAASAALPPVQSRWSEQALLEAASSRQEEDILLPAARPAGPVAANSLHAYKEAHKTPALSGSQDMAEPKFKQVKPPSTHTRTRSRGMHRDHAPRPTETEALLRLTDTATPASSERSREAENSPSA